MRVLDHGSALGADGGDHHPQLCDAIGVRQVRRYALTGERFGPPRTRAESLVHEVGAWLNGKRGAQGRRAVCWPTAREAMAETKRLRWKARRRQ